MADNLLPGERKIRFGCGAIAGLFLIGLSFLADPQIPPWGGLLVALAGACVFGWAAARWGDRFWEWLGRWWIG